VETLSATANPVFENTVAAQEKVHVYSYPSVEVNGVALRGEVTPTTVMDMLCTSIQASDLAQPKLCNWVSTRLFAHCSSFLCVWMGSLACLISHWFYPTAQCTINISTFIYLCIHIYFYIYNLYIYICVNIYSIYSCKHIAESWSLAVNSYPSTLIVH
jgi:hypothetical protein